MFYLKYFFRIINFKPFVSIIFILLTILISNFFAHFDLIEKKLFFLKSSDFEENPYFYALTLEQSSLDSYIRKLGMLPGVIKVEVVSSEALNMKISNMMNEVKNLVPEDLTEKKYKGIKIILANQIRPRSLQLIQEYLVRLFGQDNITISEVKMSKEEKTKKMKNYFLGFKKWSALVFSILVFVFWLISLFSFRSAIYKFCTVTQFYQRRKNLKLKTILTAIGVVFSISLGICLIIDTPNMTGILLFGSVFIIAIFTSLLARKMESKA